jgi:hypothetical protein
MRARVVAIPPSLWRGDSIEVAARLAGQRWATRDVVISGWEGGRSRGEGGGRPPYPLKE